ncbi:MAG: hypothetical protein HFG45_01070 [Oscillospiraceae bacterium]|nr:hypothetical protein [Oscillospiraceae bacterium]
MKKHIRLLSVILALALTFSMIPLANAVEQRGSDYFAASGVQAFAEGGGKVLIEFDIAATDMMDEIGASKIRIYEQQPNGTYSNVHTYTRDDDGMMFTNDCFAYGDIYYQGISGRKYYAAVSMYCKDSTGSETITRNTNVVTA